MIHFLKLEVLHNSIADYLIAFSIMALGILAIRLFQRLLHKRLKYWARQTASSWDDTVLQLLERALIPFLYLGVVYLGLDNLSLHPPILKQLINGLLLIASTVIAVRLLVTLCEKGLQFYYRRRDDGENLEKIAHALIPALRTVAWSLGGIFVLDNLGFNVSAMLAGLGIGGVAIALASQGLLVDLFSYFAILVDRPFELGDVIQMGNLMGTVKHVGIKTTRIQSVSGEEVIIANKDLTSGQVHNYKRMEQRRVVFQLGVAYQTPLEQLKTIPDLIRHIIEPMEHTRFDRAHFSRYGDTGLNFEVVYFVQGNDYRRYMDIQQAINLELKQEFEQQGIQFVQTAPAGATQK
uniref:MscS Mechanosensitive ion channel n=1 Tax=Cyanothece sp. (strain PCC 7425 / ATCC 29141) TaxID=395961 RepID=B8HJY7_CYAP4